MSGDIVALSISVSVAGHGDGSVAGVGAVVVGLACSERRLASSLSFCLVGGFRISESSEVLRALSRSAASLLPVWSVIGFRIGLGPVCVAVMSLGVVVFGVGNFGGLGTGWRSGVLGKRG